MPRYRLKAVCGWIANSTTTLDEVEAENEDEAHERASSAAMERIETWVELIEEDE